MDPDSSNGNGDHGTKRSRITSSSSTLGNGVRESSAHGMAASPLGCAMLGSGPFQMIFSYLSGHEHILLAVTNRIALIASRTADINLDIRTPFVLFKADDVRKIASRIVSLSCYDTELRWWTFKDVVLPRLHTLTIRTLDDGEERWQLERMSRALDISFEITLPALTHLRYPQVQEAPWWLSKRNGATFNGYAVAKCSQCNDTKFLVHCRKGDSCTVARDRHPGICYSCVDKMRNDNEQLYIECQRCHQFVHDGEDTTEPVAAIAAIDTDDNDDDDNGAPAESAAEAAKPSVAGETSAIIGRSCDLMEPSSCCHGGHDADDEGDHHAPTPVCSTCATTCGICHAHICYHLWTDDLADPHAFDPGHYTCLRCDTPVCRGCAEFMSVTLCRVCRALCINAPDDDEIEQKSASNIDDTSDNGGDDNEDGNDDDLLFGGKEPADTTEIMFRSSVRSDTNQVKDDNDKDDNGSDSDSDDNPAEVYDGDNEGGNEPIDHTELDDLITNAALPLAKVLPAGFTSIYPIIYPSPSSSSLSSSSSSSSLPSSSSSSSLVSVCDVSGDPRARVHVTIVSTSWHVTGTSSSSVAASKIIDYTIDIDCIPQRAVGQHEPNRGGPCGHTTYCSCHIDR